jgi:hypothetical protein
VRKRAPDLLAIDKQVHARLRVAAAIARGGWRLEGAGAWRLEAAVRRLRSFKTGKGSGSIVLSLRTRHVLWICLDLLVLDVPIRCGEICGSPMDAPWATRSRCG